MKPNAIIIAAISLFSLTYCVCVRIDEATAPRPGVVLPAPAKQKTPPKPKEPDCPS